MAAEKRDLSVQMGTSKADLVEVLSVGAVEQRLEDDDGLVKVPHKHSVYCVDCSRCLLHWAVHITRRSTLLNCRTHVIITRATATTI